VFSYGGCVVVVLWVWLLLGCDIVVLVGMLLFVIFLL